MASSDNLPSFEPWLLRSAFPADPWLSDSFALDTDALTKALSFSTSAPSDHSLFDLLNDSSSPNPSPVYPATPRCASQSLTVSGSGSDPDTASKRRVPGPAAGRAGKRKSRASKKSPTTFITADAENFRQMVQQVTGIQFSSEAGGVPSALGSILKPAPQRLGAYGVGGRIQGLLPTLDTSAFLLDHHQEVVGHGAAAAAQAGVSAALGTPSGEIGSASGVDGRGGLDFGSFSCFPTLDSWEVM